MLGIKNVHQASPSSSIHPLMKTIKLLDAYQSHKNIIAIDHNIDTTLGIFFLKSAKLGPKEV